MDMTYETCTGKPWTIALASGGTVNIVGGGSMDYSK
jgi:hypothetical protein